MSKYDPRKTYLDLEPPRFDVSGDKVTGEFDNIKTPELEKVYEIEIVETGEFWRHFCAGLAIGAITFIVCYVLISLGGR